MLVLEAPLLEARGLDAEPLYPRLLWRVSLVGYLKLRVDDVSLQGLDGLQEEGDENGRA